MFLLHKDLRGFHCAQCDQEVLRGEFVNHLFYCCECSLTIEEIEDLVLDIEEVQIVFGIPTETVNEEILTTSESI